MLILVPCDRFVLPVVPRAPDAVFYLTILGWIGMPFARELEPCVAPPDRDMPVESEPAVLESCYWPLPWMLTWWLVDEVAVIRFFDIF